MKPRRPYPGRICGFNTVQIAALMGCSFSAAKYWIQRAKRERAGKLEIQDLRDLIYNYWEYKKAKAIHKGLEALRYNPK